MIARTFVDSNILIYAHDLDAGEKRAIAVARLSELWDNRSGVVSPQVLQEFYVNVTRKITKPLARKVARAIVENYAVWCVETAASDIANAFRIEDESKIAFWDALICASASKAGAICLLSEDLRSGQIIAGIRVENPFAEQVRSLFLLRLLPLHRNLLCIPIPDHMQAHKVGCA